jgi:hypothetical protein
VGSRSSGSASLYHALVHIGMRSYFDPGLRDGVHGSRLSSTSSPGAAKRPQHKLAREHIDEARDAAFGRVAAGANEPWWETDCSHVLARSHRSRR